MLENPQDRRGGSMATIQGLELAHWERLVFKLRLVDTWHLGNIRRGTESLRFSRSDQRIGHSLDVAEIGTRGERVHVGTNESRIDRIYLGENISTLEGDINILPGTTLSDHAPVVLNIVHNPGKNMKEKQQG